MTQECDALVAERVMGWTQVHLSQHDYHGVDGDHDWWIDTQAGTLEAPVEDVNGWDTDPDIDGFNPTESMEAAWLVVEKLSNEGQVFTLGAPHPLFSSPRSHLWEARFGNKSAYGRTAPEAICLAALACVATLAESSDSSPQP